MEYIFVALHGIINYVMLHKQQLICMLYLLHYMELLIMLHYINNKLKPAIPAKECLGRQIEFEYIFPVYIYFLSTYIPVLHLKYAYLRLASISNIYINF